MATTDEASHRRHDEPPPPSPLRALLRQVALLAAYGLLAGAQLCIERLERCPGDELRARGDGDSPRVRRS